MFTSETAALAGSQPKLRLKKAFHQAARMQDILFEKIGEEGTKLSEASQASRAWVELHDLRRRLLGLGDPKSVPASNDPASAPRKRKPGTATASAGLSDGPADGAS